MRGCRIVANMSAFQANDESSILSTRTKKHLYESTSKRSTFLFNYLFTAQETILIVMTENASTLLVNRAIIIDDKQVLLLQRSSNDSRNAGLWEFPGGKIDSGEEMNSGLAREVLEETGLEIEIASSIAHVETELIEGGKYNGRLYVALFYAVQRLTGDVVLSGEHDAAAWEEPSSAAEYDLTPESRRALLSLHKLGII